MFNRIINLSKTNSFFLFGARETGKSTLLREHFAGLETGCVQFDMKVTPERVSACLVVFAAVTLRQVAWNEYQYRKSVTNLPGARVRIFGSRSRGDYKKYSDLDRIG